MLIAIGQARAKDGCREDLLTAAAKVAVATRDDAGCELYSFAIDVTDADVVLSIEIWRDQKWLDAHMAHDHTAQFLSEVGGLVAGAPTMSFYSATDVQPTTEGIPS